MVEVDKRPGWDWTVFYRWDDEPAPQAIAVFGAMTPEHALQEARSSLGKEVTVLGLLRQDAPISIVAALLEE